MHILIYTYINIGVHINIYVHNTGVGTRVMEGHYSISWLPTFRVQLQYRINVITVYLGPSLTRLLLCVCINSRAVLSYRIDRNQRVVEL